MNWIRGPWWDSCWFLSGPIIGLLMLIPLLLPHGPDPVTRLMLGYFLLSLNLGHTLSPIVLSWSHDGFRRVMLARPRKYIGVPVLVMILGVGATTLLTYWLAPYYQPTLVELESLTWENLEVPFRWLMVVYVVWNFYHAGAQNFGMVCLYRGKGYRGKEKLLVLLTCVALTVFVSHEIPRIWHFHFVTLLCLGVITVNHWTVAIGLCGHVYSRHTERSPWRFIARVVVAGGVLGYFLFAAVKISPKLGILFLSFRASLGIWHFLQDRWVWKLSDPQMRATIGRDLLEEKGPRPLSRLRPLRSIMLKLNLFERFSADHVGHAND